MSSKSIDKLSVSLSLYIPLPPGKLQYLPEKKTGSTMAFSLKSLSYFALILLPLASCVTSARPSASIRGGIYMPTLPRNPFFKPYHPPTGLFSARPHASTVPSLAGFCSSALPSSIQSPCFLSMACKSSRIRAS